jgi:hypothetical protein
MWAWLGLLLLVSAPGCGTTPDATSQHGSSRPDTVSAGTVSQYVMQAFEIRIEGARSDGDLFSLEILSPGVYDGSVGAFPFCEPTSMPCTNVPRLRGAGRLISASSSQLVLETWAKVRPSFQYRFDYVAPSGAFRTLASGSATASSNVIVATYVGS